MYNNYEEFKTNYDESYEKQYGFFRFIVDHVVHDYLKCGDMKEGFARVRCTNSDCHNEYLLASKTWRELIKKVWEVDPLTCPQCGSDLPVIASSGEAGGDEDY